MIKTSIISQSQITKKWYIVNGENQILGRFASQLSQLLLNKSNTLYTPFLLPLTHIIILNADKILISGRKKVNKNYLTYSGYQGGLKFKTFLQVQSSNSDKILRSAIRGMVAKNFIGQKSLLNLYTSSNLAHIYMAQTPQLLTFFNV